MNYMTEVREKTCICRKCDGSGKVEVTKEKLRQLIWGETFDKAFRMVKEWVSSARGTVECGQCDGEGKWVEQY